MYTGILLYTYHRFIYTGILLYTYHRFIYTGISLYSKIVYCLFVSIWFNCVSIKHITCTCFRLFNAFLSAWLVYDTRSQDHFKVFLFMVFVTRFDCIMVSACGFSLIAVLGMQLLKCPTDFFPHHKRLWFYFWGKYFFNFLKLLQMKHLPLSSISELCVWPNLQELWPFINIPSSTYCFTKCQSLCNLNFTYRYNHLHYT